jgi:hypothetical protein
MKTKTSIGVPILMIRGQRVVLDADLAVLYGAPTKVLNQAVKRNQKRFPKDFCFQLTEIEAKEVLRSRSQFVTLKRGQNIKYRPWAFTEYGALQAANILRSERAVEMSLYVIRAFVKMREELATNAAILKRLAEIDKTLLEHDSVLRDVYKKLLPMLQPPLVTLRRQIGFNREGEK